MRIAFLVHHFLPRWLAGTEIYTYNIARHLAGMGHEVHVITTLDRGLPGKSQEEGFYIHRIGVPKLRFLEVTSLWLRSLPVLRNINPDIVHAQGTDVGIPGIVASKLAGKRSVVWGQGSDILVPSLLGRQASRLVLRWSDAAIALTKQMQDEMRDIHRRRGKIYILPTSIELSAFGQVYRERARVRDELQLRPGERLIIYVGSLRPVKGVAYLIQAMATIKKRAVCARLMLVGDGPDRQSLEGLASQLQLNDCILFAGRTPHEKIPDHMAAADIFVLPSLSEGFSTVTLEAMASGLPLVVSRTGGMPEIVQDGENGFLVEPRDPSQLAERILSLLKNDSLREIMSKRNLEKVKMYDYGNVVKQLVDIYFEIAKR